MQTNEKSRSDCQYYLVGTMCLNCGTNIKIWHSRCVAQLRIALRIDRKSKRLKKQKKKTNMRKINKTIMNDIEKMYIVDGEPEESQYMQSWNLKALIYFNLRLLSWKGSATSTFWWWWHGFHLIGGRHFTLYTLYSIFCFSLQE